MNASVSRLALQKLLDLGVREFCLCAGARNAPLVSALEKVSGIQLFHFFEERSASFFALGRTRASVRPVVVVTTSGTAVVECFPAVVEGHYQGLPLIVLSADRPTQYRGTGAPQSIEQAGIFNSYVELAVDIQTERTSLDFSQWSRRGPLHINVCLEEPIPGEALAELKIPEPVPFIVEQSNETGRLIPDLQDPIVLIGQLAEDEKYFVRKFLRETQLPFVAEGPAGLAPESDWASRRLRAAEKTLPLAVDNGLIQSVIRLGGVPTLRFWRDLEKKYQSLPVVSFSNRPFSGLARASTHLVGFELLEALQIRWSKAENLQSIDSEKFEKLKVLLKKYPDSEPSIVLAFAKATQGESVYLGNSLPIREWDLVASEFSHSSVWANRGANGIDGQVSSFLGWVRDAGNPAWALIGDLTAMYDLAGLWISPHLEQRDRRIVVINNFGGQIFKSMFGKEIFLNRHRIQFQNWAQMWSWDYCCGGAEVFEKNLSARQVIELRPHEKATEDFHREWRES